MLAVTAKGILTFEVHDEVETLVLNAGERAGRIETERTQHRLDLVLEVLFQPFLRFRAPARAAQQADALRGQGWQQHLVQTPILLGDQS